MARPRGVQGGVDVRTHASELGAWSRVTRDPPADLADAVTSQYGFWQRLARPSTHRGVSDGTLPLFLSFGPTTDLRGAGGTAEVERHGSFLAGPDDRVTLIDADEFDGMQLNLTPVGAHRLTGLPLRELQGLVVPLDAVLGADADRLVDQVLSTAHWPARFRLVEDLCRRRLADAPEVDPVVVHVSRRLEETGGRVPVGALADEVGWSPRRLRARFGDVVGLSPKRMARLVRFRAVVAQLADPHGPDLATVAARGGFSDQAHLTREVRAFSGLTPTQLVAARLPDDGGIFDDVAAG